MLKEEQVMDLFNNFSDRCSLFQEEKNFLQSLFCLDLTERKRILMAADEKRKFFHGKKLYVRGVIELSNICKNKCKYCSMSSDNESLHRYIIPKEEVFEILFRWVNMGIKVFHFSSGEQNGYLIEDLVEILECVHSLKAKAIIVLGNKRNNDLIKMKKACPDITLIEKFETSNPWLYNEYNDKNGNLEFRLSQLNIARELGFKIGTGNIVGLPYQSHSTLIDDLMMLKKIKPDQASTSNYIRSGQSVFSKFKEKSNVNDNTKLFIALMRLGLDGKTIIPTNSSLGTVGKEEALHCGANLVSLNLTPEQYLDNYIIYDKKRRKKADIDSVFEIAKLNKMEVEFEF